MSVETREITSLKDLVAALEALPCDRDRYQATLESIRFGREEVAPYCHFDDRFYTRNLIARTDDFELMVLCWQPGQTTPIHDHARSDGWVLGIEGVVEEVRYHWSEDLDGSVKVEAFETGRLGRGELAYINDDVGLHTVGASGGRPAVSLHFYSPPIDACHAFDPETRSFRARRLSYHSVHGVVRRVEEVATTGSGPGR